MHTKNTNPSFVSSFDFVANYFHAFWKPLKFTSRGFSSHLSASTCELKQQDGWRAAVSLFIRLHSFHVDGLNVCRWSAFLLAKVNLDHFKRYQLECKYVKAIFRIPLSQKSCSFQGRRGIWDFFFFLTDLSNVILLPLSAWVVTWPEEKVLGSPVTGCVALFYRNIWTVTSVHTCPTLYWCQTTTSLHL